jgi:hypothetical protein
MPRFFSHPKRATMFRQAASVAHLQKKRQPESPLLGEKYCLRRRYFTAFSALIVATFFALLLATRMFRISTKTEKAMAK